MSLVVTVWMYSLGDLFVKKTEAKASASNEIKPFALFANSISETYQNISASVGKISTKKSTKTEESIINKQIDLVPVEYVNN